MTRSRAAVGSPVAWPAARVLALALAAACLLAFASHAYANGSPVTVTTTTTSGSGSTTSTATSTTTTATATSSTSTATSTTSSSTFAASTPLAATPYMGWDSYYAFGGRIDQETILGEAQDMLALGLPKLGYRYVWLDVGWWSGTRDDTGAITVNPTQWPNGIAWLANTLHSEGLLLGLYTDAGTNGCGGPFQGSYQHYQQDIDTFASWGVDAIKVDFCGGVRLGLDPQTAYTQVHQAIVAAEAATHRPMLLNVCNFLEPGQFAASNPAFTGSSFTSSSWGPGMPPSAGAVTYNTTVVANSWRTDTDLGTPGKVAFASVLRNMDADSAMATAAGPGHWNDPDYLAPGQGMSAAQFQVQMTMWAMLSAPLMVSANLQSLGTASLAAIRNPQVIAIDQDPAGRQAQLIADDGYGQVWDKPLANGSRAIAFLNRSTPPITISAAAVAVGAGRAASYSLTNVWTGAKSTTSGTFSAKVPGDSVVLLEIARNAASSTSTAKARRAQREERARITFSRAR